MEKFAEILHAAGVDVSTLESLFTADMEAIHRLTVDGAAAIAMWEKLRGLVRANRVLAGAFGRR